MQMTKERNMQIVKKSHTAEVPVIDISGFKGGSESARTRIASAVASALEETGFFVIKGHGVDPQVVPDLRALAWQFFDLPLDVKMLARKPIKGAFRGYVTAADENLSFMSDDDLPADLKEFLGFGQFDYGNDPYYQQDFAEFAFPPNLWPEQPAGLKEAAMRYYREMEILTERLLRIFEKGLGLTEGFFRDKFDHHAATARILNYPNQVEDPLPGQLRCGAHTDFGAITLLAVDNAPGGLQVQSRAGDWLAIPSVPEGIVLNIGDLMMGWTNDRWRSGLHRVVNPPRDATGSTRRMSLAYFANPNYDAVVECIPTCVEPGSEPLYAPIEAGEYRLQKIMKATKATSGAKADPVSA
jgi:isopenicillin N synthase-like dioxygenase